MQIDLLLLKRMLLAIVVFMGITLPSQGQIPLTIDKAMEIAHLGKTVLLSAVPI